MTGPEAEAWIRWDRARDAAMIRAHQRRERLATIDPAAVRELVEALAAQLALDWTVEFELREAV